MDQPANKNPYPWWKVKIWHGMTLVTWLRLLVRYRFDVSLIRLHRSVIVTIVAVFNQIYALGQTLRYGLGIARAPLLAPVFIIGHWRTGTTFLHELLAVDERFVTPTAMQCMCPDHFLFSRPAIGLLEFMLPKNRPMDDFEIRWNAPQEDEFALLAMGARSPYELFAFPRAFRKALSALDVEALSAGDSARWQRKFTRFLRTLAYDRIRTAKSAGAALPQFILLKSPTHTARLGLLASMFPDARFIHLTRERHTLFASSVSLWRAMLATQALHKPPVTTPEGEALNHALALEAFDRLYAGFERDRARAGEGRIIDVRFEDLTREPRRVVEDLYRFLGIDLAAPVAARLDARIAAFNSYEAARHHLPASDESLVETRWAHYPDRYRRPLPGTA